MWLLHSKWKLDPFWVDFELIGRIIKLLVTCHGDLGEGEHSRSGVRLWKKKWKHGKQYRFRFFFYSLWLLAAKYFHQNNTFLFFGANQINVIKMLTSNCTSSNPRILKLFVTGLANGHPLITVRSDWGWTDLCGWHRRLTCWEDHRGRSLHSGYRKGGLQTAFSILVREEWHILILNYNHQEKDVKDWKAFQDVGEARLEVDWLVVEHKDASHVS